ncbi:DUF560 domain-containing protein [Luteimonas viscosa]|uniref:DUF560 domain-containing protein n=1 Tax=Luteimonas viscosa TaxID=1132694 RepID=A0A5D4XLR5_9GAMM|nr:surface lipoprotein assembly modifier [Luteimonas viscosa]TYT23610.1 DUF560 domain-containing protein [Luteimonas viscosa]
MRNRRKGLPAACVAVLAVAPLHAHAVRVDYAVDAGVERNDNVLMSSTDPTESSALRAGVGFVVAEETSTVQANIGGRFDYWNYVDGPQSNTFETSLSGRLNWFFVPETLSFTIEDSLEMRPIDRFAPDSVDNRQRVNVLSLGPNLHFNWSQAVRGRAEVRWIDSSAEEEDEFESQRVSAALHAIRALDQTSSVTLSLRGQDVDFDNDLTARDYRRYDGYVRYQKQLVRLGFAFDAGYTWVDYADGSSASHPMLRGQLDWQFSPRNALSLGLAHQLTDSSDSALQGIGAVTEVPDSLSSATSAVDASVYEEDRIDLTYAYRHERVDFTIGPYYERVDYVDPTGFDETRRGVVLQLSYRLSQTWDLRTFADVARSNFTDLGLRTEDKRFGLGLSRTWSRHWSSALDYLHYRRDDEGPFGDSRQNVWYLTVTYRNR